ncbi:MAG: cytochrome b/b6 domain-containing protein [Francisellaceae bacterium]
MIWLKKISLDFWHYLGKVQGGRLRLIHITMAILIVIQIIDSNFMHVHYPKPVLDFADWFHITIGFITLSIFLVFVAICFAKKGVKHYYPYLFLDFSQLRQDVKTLMRLKLPHANPYGMATSVQGLGLGALILVILSGALWFIAWWMNAPAAHELKSLHKSLTLLIEIYIIAHGVMGVFHFLMVYYCPQRLE